MPCLAFFRITETPRCDVERFKIFTTKSTGCYPWDGQFHRFENIPVRGIDATHTTTTAEGDPDVVVLINRHTVRRAFQLGRIDRNSLVGNIPTLNVIVERTHLLARCIDVVKRSTILRPAKTVGIGHLGKLGGQFKCRIKAIQGRIAFFLHRADRTCPETPYRIAFSVIEAIIGFLVRLRIDNGCLASGLRIKKGESVVSAHHESPALSRNHESNSFGDVPCFLFTSDRVKAANQVAFDVDVVDLAFEPQGAFPPLGESF